MILIKQKINIGMKVEKNGMKVKLLFFIPFLYGFE